MTEYEEITNGKTIPELEKELQYQLDLGFNIGDSFPQHIVDCISQLKRKQYNNITILNNNNNHAT